MPRNDTETPPTSEEARQLPDRRRPERLWQQVEQAMQARITGGEWPAGSQIPAEDRLCAMFGVSRITLRHALRNLEEKGLLRREHGRGTFVRRSMLVASTRELTSFTQEMSHLGMRAGSRLLHCSLSTAGAEAAAALEIAEGSETVLIRRLRLGDDQPIGIQTVQLAGARVPGFLDHGAMQGSLYEALEKQYAISPLEARETYRVGTIGEEDAKLLDAQAGSPAFVVERVTTDEHGPFEFTTSVMRGDRYEIQAALRLAGRPAVAAKPERSGRRR